MSDPDDWPKRTRLAPAPYVAPVPSREVCEFVTPNGARIQFTVHERFPTLLAIGLGPSLDAIERVTAWAQRGKHAGKKWAEQDRPHQIAKMLGHMAEGMKGKTADEETGEHPFAHVAARALMLLGLALEK